ncbi:MAG: hypothetical protein K2K48_00565 [Anaeroplasmataceae bacterium]|nr:hypothetical protein [Anaeroplasmataceae bacterium]MDE6413889.1 hypothetical protein [Anaeroplasmataceae bacterium]
MLKAIDGILSFLFRVSKKRDKAKRIKEDEEKRETSLYFGIESIAYSVLSTGMCVLGAWLFVAFSDTGLVLFTIIAGLTFVIGGLISFFWALVGWILQLSINKKWIGWIAILVFIAGLVGSVLFVLGLLGGMS